MNQILMVENQKKKRNRSSSGPVEIEKIVRFFAIALIVFGIFFIGHGSYAIYKDSKGRNVKNMPTVSISRVNDSIVIKAEGINKIENLRYKWNEGEETVVSVNDTYIEETAFLPVEDSTLVVIVEESSGRIIRYTKHFKIEGVDIIQPTIQITEEDTKGNIRITATDETAISYITYKVNDEDEIRIDKSEIENKTINYVLKLQKGSNMVRITAVDQAGNIEKVEKKIIVSGSTTIEPKIQNGQIIIDIKDPDGIKDIVINLNGVVYQAKDVNQKSVRIPLKPVTGVNTLKVTVINVNSLVSEGTTEINYAQ